MKPKKNTVCLVAGKSAGHILPALTLVQQLKNQKPDLKTIFISNHTALDYQALNHNPVINKHIAINLIALPYRQVWLIPKFIWQLFNAWLKAYQLLKQSQPNQVISTGGLIAVPVCLAAKYLKIPIIIHELNVTPGKATKFLAKIASEVQICFKQTAQFLPSHKCILTSYPNRFNSSDYNLTKLQALEIIQAQNSDFNHAHKTILILGGSQGSLFINQAIHRFIKSINQTTNENNKLNLQIIHQTGHNDQTNWPEFYAQHQIPALVFSYHANLMPCYILADLIICRAGAGTLAEILPLKTPTITIPLENSYTCHQLENAIALAQENHWLHVLRQNQITQDFKFFDNLIKNKI